MYFYEKNIFGCILSLSRSFSLPFPQLYYFGNNHMKIPKIFHVHFSGGGKRGGKENVITDRPDVCVFVDLPAQNSKAKMSQDQNKSSRVSLKLFSAVSRCVSEKQKFRPLEPKIRYMYAAKENTARVIYIRLASFSPPPSPCLAMKIKFIVIFFRNFHHEKLNLSHESFL